MNLHWDCQPQLWLLMRHHQIAQSPAIKIVEQQHLGHRKSMFPIDISTIHRLHSHDLLLSLPASYSSLCFALARRLWAKLNFTNFTILHATCLPTVVCNSIVFNLLLVLGFSKRRGVTPTFNGGSIYVLLWSHGKWRLQELWASNFHCV